jgi:hypothetical protein
MVFFPLQKSNNPINKKDRQKSQYIDGAPLNKKNAWIGYSFVNKII